MFNASLTNISIISGRSTLFVWQTGIPGENHQPATSRLQTLSHSVVSSTPHHEEDSNSQLDCRNISAYNNLWGVIKTLISNLLHTTRFSIRPKLNARSQKTGKRNNLKKSLGARKSKGINYVYRHLTIFHYVWKTIKLWVRTPFLARCTRYDIIWLRLLVTWDESVCFLMVLWFPLPIRLTTTI